MGSIIAAIGSVILSLAGYGVQEAITGFSLKTKNQLTSIAKAIYNKMSKNQKYMDNLYDAFLNNRNALQSMLMTGAGFGPRINAIYKEIQDSEKDYKEKKSELTDKQAKYQNDYNEVTNAQNQAGTGIIANLAAQEVADKMNQYVTGGLKTDGIQEKQI